MIISENTDMVKQTNEQEGLPTYDMATSQGSEPSAPSSPLLQPAPGPSTSQGHDVKVNPNSLDTTAMQVMGQSQPYVLPPTPVYHYTDPRTGERVVSLLPPDHPEMICLQEGQHMTESRFGVLGVLAAIFWFPLGVGLCLLDRRVRCTRCGQNISNGLCG